MSIKRNKINAPSAPSVVGGYSQAVNISAFDELLFISGQIPVSKNGVTPSAFKAQAAQVWDNISAQLKAGGMSLGNIVKITIFLADRKFADDNQAIRDQYLGNLCPALTVIICDIFDESWFLEIEAIAAR